MLNSVTRKPLYKGHRSTYVCMYVCMYESMYVCVYVQAGISVNQNTFPTWPACMHACMYVCVHVQAGFGVSTFPMWPFKTPMLWQVYVLKSWISAPYENLNAGRSVCKQCYKRMHAVWKNVPKTNVCWPCEACLQRALYIHQEMKKHASVYTHT